MRLLRWTLLLWFSILAFDAAFTFLSVQPGIDLTSQASRSGLPLLFMLAVGITWPITIVRLIQSEPVWGTSSFWRTRPIPPLVFVASKVLFILLLSILPSLLLHGLELWFYRAHGEVARAMISSLVIVDALMALAVVWLATYTRNVLQFWAVICALALVFFVALSFYVQRHLLVPAHSDPPGLLASRFEISFYLLVGGLLVSLAIQHGFRRTRTALITGSVCVVLSGLAQLAWPFTLPWLSKIPAAENRNAVHVAYQFNRQVPVSWQSSTIGTVSEKSFNISLQPSVVSQGLPAPDLIEGTFQSPNGEKIGLESDVPGGRWPAYDWTDLLQKSRPDLTIVSSGNGSREQAAVLHPSSEPFDELEGKTGTLDLKIQGTFWKLVPRAALPLRGSRFARIPNFVVRIVSATNSPQGLEFEVSAVGYAKQGYLPLVFLLVDEKNRLGTVATSRGMSTTQNTLTGSEWSLLYADTTLGLDLGSLPTSMQPTLRRNQADDWTLVIYETRPAGSFESDLTVPSVKL